MCYDVYGQGMTAATELVHLTVQSGIATITLDSPTNRNALSAQLRAELLEALRDSAHDRSVRVVVLDHTGSAFCSGMDLREPRTDGNEAVSEFRQILEYIWTHPKPVVAKLTGSARAGGIGMVAAADVAVAAHDANFAFTEVRIGLVPAMISVTVLPRLLPHAAHELFLTGETFDATRAVAVGLLNSTVPTGQLAAEVTRYTNMLITAAPEALTLTKQILHRNHSSAMSENFTAMLELSAQRFASAEAREGIRAFTEKRSPWWMAAP